ncbi:hypothetical protein QQ045_010894 [Rhodiola kirilowii]
MSDCKEVRGYDYTDEIPDECLACIFQSPSLTSADKENCSLVCRRWYQVEGRSRQRLCLNAEADLSRYLRSLLSRFDSMTKLSLRCDRRTSSVDNEALVLISTQCRKLTRLKLRGCRGITDVGMASFARNCKGLKGLSIGSCMFGASGLNSVLNNCSSLEDLSVKRLRSMKELPGSAELIGPGLAAASLKSISLVELYNGQCFAPLIIGAKKLKTLRLYRCLGDWDRILVSIGKNNNNLVDVHLEKIRVGDVGLSALASCAGLEVLHIVKAPECSDVGVISVAEGCKNLRKLHIDGWRTNRIGDDGLLAIAKHCPNIQELVLVGMNPTPRSLVAVATNCRNLGRLVFCGSETVADATIACIADKCISLRKLCIKGCPISNNAVKALAHGFPSLQKVKVTKCRGVNIDAGIWLQENRGSLFIVLEPDQVFEDEAAGIIESVQIDADDF